MTNGKEKRGESFEMTLAEVERIVQEIEEGELPLDKVVEHFKSATTMIARCRSMLQEVEQQIKTLENETQGDNS